MANGVLMFINGRPASCEPCSTRVKQATLLSTNERLGVRNRA